MELKQLKEEIKKIIAEEVKYLKTYTGKIIDINDPLKRGRVKCYVLELYWIDGESAVWIEPRYTRSMLKLKKDNFVQIGFTNGNRKRPYYFGISQDLKDMKPSKYDGTLQVLFQSNEGDLLVTYNDDNKELIAIIGDNTYTINEDGIIREDANGNIETWDSNGIAREDTNGNKEDMTSSGIVREDTNGNKEEMTTTGIKLTNANSDVIDFRANLLNIFAATESFLKGNTWQTNWTTFNTSVQTATSGTTAQNAAGIVTIKAAFAVFFAQVTNMLSTKIKGE